MAKKSKINASDLRGLTGIITDASINITDLVEELNKRIVHPPFLVSTPLQHLITNIFGIAYDNVRLATKIIGRGVEETLAQFHPLFEIDVPSEKKELTIGILNGIVGDYLYRKNNPLAIPMQFRHEGKSIGLHPDAIRQTYPNANGKILLLVHGLCMNDFLWERHGHHHGKLLAQELDKTLVHLHYNTGLHISTNGQKFNEILEELVQSWPVPIEEIVIVAHSMGGLVSRSALYYGQKEEKTWTKLLKKVVFLGSPHHGAPLEQMGNYIDLILDAIPYTKPFSRLGKIRSSGITDLRFGNLVDEDWKGLDRFKKHQQERAIIPLPKGIDFYTIAAMIQTPPLKEDGKESDDWDTQILGDGLVQLESALGQHENPNRTLGFKKSNQSIVYECNHLDLLCNLEVYNRLKSMC